MFPHLALQHYREVGNKTVSGGHPGPTCDRREDDGICEVVAAGGGDRVEWCDSPGAETELPRRGFTRGTVGVGILGFSQVSPALGIPSQ